MDGGTSGGGGAAAASLLALQAPTAAAAAIVHDAILADRVMKAGNTARWAGCGRGTADGGACADPDLKRNTQCDK